MNISIRAHHTFGEKPTGKTQVAQMLDANYVGRYPHFLLVAARRYMIVNRYPSSTFEWTEGQPCYHNCQSLGDGVFPSVPSGAAILE